MLQRTIVGETKRADRATELEWLKWFYENVELYHEDHRLGLKLRFMAKTGKNLPEGHNDGYFAGAGQTNLDEVDV